MDRPSKRRKTEPATLNDSEGDDDELNFRPEEASARRDPEVRFENRRKSASHRLQFAFENIFAKYGQDFDGVGDEVDMMTGEVLVDNGHLRKMRKRKDVLRARRDDADDSDDEQAQSSSSSGSQGDETSPSLEPRVVPLRGPEAWMLPGEKMSEFDRMAARMEARAAALDQPRNIVKRAAMKTIRGSGNLDDEHVQQVSARRLDLPAARPSNQATEPVESPHPSAHMEAGKRRTSLRTPRSSLGPDQMSWSQVLDQGLLPKEELQVLDSELHPDRGSSSDSDVLLPDNHGLDAVSMQTEGADLVNPIKGGRGRPGKTILEDGGGAGQNSLGKRRPRKQWPSQIQEGLRNIDTERRSGVLSREERTNNPQEDSKAGVMERRARGRSRTDYGTKPQVDPVAYSGRLHGQKVPAKESQERRGAQAPSLAKKRRRGLPRKSRERQPSGTEHPAATDGCKSLYQLSDEEAPVPLTYRQGSTAAEDPSSRETRAKGPSRRRTEPAPLVTSTSYPQGQDLSGETVRPETSRRQHLHRMSTRRSCASDHPQPNAARHSDRRTPRVQHAATGNDNEPPSTISNSTQELDLPSPKEPPPPPTAAAAAGGGTPRSQTTIPNSTATETPSRSPAVQTPRRQQPKLNVTHPPSSRNSILSFVEDDDDDDDDHAEMFGASSVKKMVTRSKTRSRYTRKDDTHTPTKSSRRSAVAS